jgi:hypothetical protein
MRLAQALAPGTLPTVREEFPIPPTIGRVLEGPEETVGIFGPVACGKTRAVCQYVMAHCHRYARDARWTGQTLRWVFVRGTFEAIKKTTLKTWLDLYPSPVAGLWTEQRKEYRVRLPKGLGKAEILFLGLDEPRDLQQLLSLDLTGAVIEEPAGGIGEGGLVEPGIPEYVYRGVLTRLRHPIGFPRRRTFVLGNPPSTAHWCHRVFRPDLPQPHGRTVVVNVPTAEAPILRVEPDYYDRLEQTLGVGTPDALRYVHGVWLKSLSGAFHRDMVPVVPRAGLPAFSAYAATVDPAAGGKSAAGDRSAIVVAGFQPGGYATILDIRAGRYEPGELLAQVFDVAAQVPLGVVGFEAVGFQTWLQAMIEQELQMRALRGAPSVLVHAVGLMRDTRIKKETRILGALGVRLANRRLSIVEDCPQADLFFQELEAFPEGAHDDVLDAVADLDQVAALANPVAAVTWSAVQALPADQKPEPVVVAQRPEADRARGLERFMGEASPRLRFWRRGRAA